MKLFEQRTLIGMSVKPSTQTAAARLLAAIGRCSSRTGWTAAILIALICWLGFAAAADDAASLRALGDAARKTLAERIEPPASRLPFLCTVGRNETAPIREYILRQQAAAIEALVASARTPNEANRVRRMLGKLERDGYDRTADAHLAETAPGAAIGLRLAASLGELPAALHQRLVPGGRCGSTYFGLVGRTFQPLGALAHADYQRLSELEPHDPWHTLVLAWLAGAEGEAALQRTLATARSTPNAARAQIFALQQLAWLRRDQGKVGEAEQAATQALRMAEQIRQRTGDDLAKPAAEQALRDVAQTGGTLALALEDSGQKSAAFEILLKVASQQRRLSELRPDDALAQMALVDTLGRLAVLRAAADTPPVVSAPAKVYRDEAIALYRSLEQRTPYSPMLDRSAWPGMLMSAGGVAGALTLLTGWALLRRYRKRIAQLMMASARKAPAPSPDRETLTQPAADRVRRGGDGSRAITEAAAARRHAAVVQVVAGLAFGITAAWLQLRADDTEPNVLNMPLMSWTWAWPTVLALGLIWDGDRCHHRLAWAAYLAGVLLICTIIALGDTPPLTMFGVTLPAFLQGLVFWAISLSFSPFLLLFLNRAVRSIGPALLMMLLVTMLGGTLALIATSTPAGMALGAAVLWSLGLPAGIMHPAAVLLGALATAPLAWWLGRRLHAAYAAKWLSDQSLVIDTLWGFQAVLLAFDLTWSLGPAGWLGLGVFALHKVITVAGMAPATRSAHRRKPLRLLLLRVFTRLDRRGRKKSRRADAERLFDLLGSRWRYAGPIAMIGAPDLASSTIEPDEFLDFLAGKLRDRFILESAEVPARLATIDDRPDLDARWRVTELFCGNDAWRAAVLGLMARSDLIAMDLRDFGRDNQGCIFELQSLMDLVPANRVALLVDESTDREFLESTLTDLLTRVPATSPNAQTIVRPMLIDARRGEQVAVDSLLRMAAAPPSPDV